MTSRRISRREFGALAAGGAALAALAACSDDYLPGRPIARETVGYGPTALQQGELRTQVGVTGQPVVVLVHGGYWTTPWDRSVMDPLADDLTRRGWATWNFDYRRVDDEGGGWTGTFEDIASGIDHLAALRADFDLALDRVAVIGHSAGAQLAFWAAARHNLPAGAVGAAPRVRPAAAISLSGVLDLETAAAGGDEGFGEAADLAISTVNLLGGTPAQVPQRYALASPIDLLPLSVPQLLLHGSGDTRVSPEQSRAYTGAAEAQGDQVDFVELPDVDHFDVIRRDHVWWSEVVTWLPDHIGRPP